MRCKSYKKCTPIDFRYIANDAFNKIKRFFSTPYTSIMILLISCCINAEVHADPVQKKPNILVIWGDDIGWQNVSAYGLGTMGYKTPNIDKIGKEGIIFTDHYGQPSCTAGRAAFITGQYPIRSGMTTVVMVK